MGHYDSCRPETAKQHRRSGNRRKQQVQGFTKQEIQTFKAFASAIQETLDPNWNARTQRAARSFWTDIYFRLGEKLRKIRNPLPKGVFRPEPLRKVRVYTETYRVVKSNGKNQPSRPPAKRRRLPGDAFSGEYDRSCVPSRESKKGVPRR